jgi:hypothetical protein
MRGSIIEKLKKNVSTIFIISGIVLILYLYNDHHRQFVRFHFPSRAIHKKAVVETGTIKYTTGEELTINNKYNSVENITKNGSELTITGKYEGEIDPKIKSFLKKSTYYIELDTADSGFDISSKFSALYPVVLKRFLYFMPAKRIFDNKQWKVATKNEEFSCSYQLFLKSDKNFISILCSGTIGDNNVAMTGDLVLNKSFNGYQSTELEITAENKYLVSDWKLREDFINGDPTF